MITDTDANQFHGIPYSIKFLGFVGDIDWKHYAWNIVVNGEHFSYKTGIGHASPMWKDHRYCARPKDVKCISDQETKSFVHIPKIEDVLNSVISDLQCGSESFDDFCDNLGYSNDSIKALEIYLSCQRNGTKMCKALGNKYTEIVKHIEEMEL